MNGTVGRERDPEEADRNEDATDLTHDEPEFRSDGAVFLDLFKRKSTQARQLCDGERGTYLLPVPKRL